MGPPATGLAPGRVEPWTVAVLAVVVAILLHASLFSSRGLVPADGMLSADPWVRTWRVLPPNHLLADQFSVFGPVRQFLHDAWQAGEFALWNPHLAAGLPTLASMQLAMLYPINLVLLPVDPFVAAEFGAALRLMLAGLFMLMYLRQLGLGSAASLAGAIVFALSAFMVMWVGHPHANAALLLPLLLWCVERLASSTPWRRGPWIVLAIAYGLVWLGGHPPTAVHISLALAAYAIFRISALREHRLVRAVVVVAACVVGLALAAPQLLPFVEYVGESSTPVTTASLNRWASHLTPVTLVHFVLPNLAGGPHLGFENLPQVLGLGTLDNFLERVGYVGILPLFLAMTAVVRRPLRVCLFFTGLAAVSLVVIYGVWPIPALIRATPVLNGINHQRLLLLVACSVAVLAACGLDYILKSRAPERPNRLAWGFAAAVGLVLLVVWLSVEGAFGRLAPDARAFLLRQGWPPIAGASVALALCYVKGSRAVVAALAVVSIAVDLLWFGTGFNPATTRDRYYPPTETTRMLQAETTGPDRARIMGVGKTFPADMAAVFQIDDVRGQDFMSVRRYEELITGRAGAFWFLGTTDQLPPSLPLLNVRTLISPTPLADVPAGFEAVSGAEVPTYRNPKATPRVLVVFDHKVDSAESILVAVRSGTFDPGSAVLLESEPQRPPEGDDRAVAALTAGARIVQYKANRVSIEATLPRAGWLLLLDTYFPGWRAYANGRELPVYRADYAFRAVPLAAGTHTVEFVYQPQSVRTGLMVFGAAVVVLLAVVISGRRSSNRAGASRP